jgi:hypothetical protein
MLVTIIGSNVRQVSLRSSSGLSYSDITLAMRETAETETGARVANGKKTMGPVKITF